MERVIVLRSGWMHWYAGGNERPIGGGSWNDDNLGHERYNFRDIDDRLYGFFQSKRDDYGVTLSRIDPAAGDENALNGVTVIFVATKPSEGGQRVVGWYRNATVFAQHQESNSKLRENIGYQVTCRTRDAVLLPLELRTWQVPVGPGGMGTTAIRYPYTQEGHLDAQPWLKEILKQLRMYDGPNELIISSNEFEEAAKNTIEATLGRRGAQGFLADAVARKAVEDRAMAAARAYFEDDAQGWEIEDTHLGHPYDLVGRKGKKTLYIEVKGTTGDGSAVLLTRNEVEWARANRCALFILHSVRLEGMEGDWTASGGESVVYEPWKIADDRLTPISYRYSPTP